MPTFETGRMNPQAFEKIGPAAVGLPQGDVRYAFPFVDTSMRALKSGAAWLLRNAP
jgi:hypothetical protein